MEKLNLMEKAKTYQSFETVEDLNQTVRRFLFQNKGRLTEQQIKVLMFIWRHSIKIPGVSFAKNETIAKEINIDRETVIRAVKRLVELGLLLKVPTSRNEQRGADILVIQQYPIIKETLNKKTQDVQLISSNQTSMETKEPTILRFIIELKVETTS